MSDYDMQTMRQLQNDNRLLSAAEAEVRTLRAQLAEAVKWKQAITDAAVVSWTLTAENENDPVKAVNALLHNAQRIALDPLVCEEAARLRDTYKDQLAARDATIEALRAHDRRLRDMMPLFQEARDALPAISMTAARVHNIDLALASRMDDVGNLDKWRKMDDKRQARTRTDELRALESDESVKMREELHNSFESGQFGVGA